MISNVIADSIRRAHNKPSIDQLNMEYEADIRKWKANFDRGRK